MALRVKLWCGRVRPQPNRPPHESALGYSTGQKAVPAERSAGSSVKHRVFFMRRGGAPWETMSVTDLAGMETRTTGRRGSDRP